MPIHLVRRLVRGGGQFGRPLNGNLMHIRRACLILPFVIPFLVHLVYQPINVAWTVKRFGCGCPPIGGGWRFNTNHFNMILWVVVLSACAISWWLLFRPEITVRRSTKFVVLRWAGVYAVLCICMKLYAAESWL